MTPYHLLNEREKINKLTLVASKKYTILHYIIAIVWLVNGLFCKVLNLVPRHQAIVARIMGHENSRLITLMIGLSEIAMSVWILSGIKPKANAIVQIGVVATMNIIELMVAPDLLLWGRLNILFATLFMLLIYFNEFVWNRKIVQHV